MANKVDVYQKALDLLSIREHSQQELFGKLKSRFVDSEDIINDVLQDLIEKNYLSNMRYGENIISYRANKGYGPNWIKQYLKSNGLTNPEINQLFALVDIPWHEIMHATKVKKYGQEMPLDYKSVAKIKSFLLSRGFLAEHIDALSDMD